ncbi:hypothetical protein, partial [Bacteroides sp.]
YGYFWSSSPFESGSASAGYLYFNNSNGLYPVYDGNRVYGFAVRCVSEVVCIKKFFPGVW